MHVSHNAVQSAVITAQEGSELMCTIHSTFMQIGDM